MEQPHSSHPRTTSSKPMPIVVCLVPDLFFATRFDNVIRAAGGRPLLVESPTAFVTAVERYFPVLALMDLGAEGDWAEALARCKHRPHTRSTPIYAFGSHVEVETLRRARQAGADHAWARSKMMEELVAVVDRHVNPPVRFPEGWDEPLSELANEGVAAFNRGEYFAQHEHFEAAWLAEPRPVRALYQGILQIGVAFLQIQEQNWPGAIKLLRRGLPRLRGLPPVCRGIDLAAFRQAAEAIHDEITALGADRLAEFDLQTFPQIVPASSEQE